MKKTTSSLLLRRTAAIAFLACVAGPPLAACGSDSTVPAAGLMVSISTNAPELVSVVALEIFLGEKRVFRNVVTVGKGVGEVTLPATLAVEPGSDPKETVSIYAYVGNEQYEILGRTIAVTIVPTTRFALLAMAVDVICIKLGFTKGKIGVDNTEQVSMCAEGETCKSGVCKSALVDSSKLPDFTGSGDGGGSGGGGGGGSGSGDCFDTEACLGAAGAYTTRADRKACTFPAPANPNLATLNVGAVTKGGGLSVLDFGEDGDWAEVPGNSTLLKLNKGACAAMNAGIFAEDLVISPTACPAKIAGFPVCGGGAGGAHEDAGGMDAAKDGAKDGVSDRTSSDGDSTVSDTGMDAKSDGSTDSGATCVGITCNTPNNVCKTLPGTCTAGVCNYTNASSSTACPGGTCNGSGVCVATNPCTGVTCNTPNNVCKTSPGTCSGGVCSYPNASNVASCPGGTCDGNGTCVSSNPCAGVTCNTPGDVCKANPGTCSGGACSYGNAPNGTVCPGGACDAGTCVPTDPCSGVTCNTPPVCRESPGTCSIGICSYSTNAPDNTPCGANGACQSGSCVDPCAANPCLMPPNDCYDMPGSCTPAGDGGVNCNYSPKGGGQSCSGGLCNGSGMCLPPPDSGMDGSMSGG